MHKFKNEFETGVWKPYVGVVFKEYCDLMLTDGTIFKSLYLNGVKWGPMGGLSESELNAYVSHPFVNKDKSLDEHHIVAFRIIPDEEIIQRGITHFTGDARIGRMNQFYPAGLSYTVFHDVELISENDYREIINKLRETAIRKINSQSLRESLAKVAAPFKRFIK